MTVNEYTFTQNDSFLKLGINLPLVYLKLYITLHEVFYPENCIEAKIKSKAMWDIINGVFNKTKFTGLETLQVNEEVIHNHIQIANYFNDYLFTITILETIKSTEVNQ